MSNGVTFSTLLNFDTKEETFFRTTVGTFFAGQWICWEQCCCGWAWVVVFYAHLCGSVIYASSLKMGDPRILAERRHTCTPAHTHTAGGDDTCGRIRKYTYTCPHSQTHTHFVPCVHSHIHAHWGALSCRPQTLQMGIIWTICVYTHMYFDPAHTYKPTHPHNHTHHTQS